MTKRIPLLRPYFDLREVEEIRNVLASGWVSQGPKVKEFEERIAEYIGIKYAIAVTNCTAALHLALISLGIKSGDQVMVADYTYPATGHAVVYCGATPIFLDIDTRTYNMIPDQIKAKMNERVKAIIPVHTFGQPAEMDEIMSIAKTYDVRVIEDAACALGAKYKNEFAGTIGDIGCFSFHARKGITTGEGGMVVTNNKEVADSIRTLSVFGITYSWARENTDTFMIPEFTQLGYNYKMSDITAAVGVAQLEKLPRIIQRKQELAKYWDEKLEELDHIEPPYVSKPVNHIYQSYVGLVDKRINRNKLIEALMKNGIQTQIGTYASHIQPIYNSSCKCPNSLEVYNRALALPMYFTLEEGDIDFAAIQLKKTMQEIQ